MRHDGRASVTPAAPDNNRSEGEIIYVCSVFISLCFMRHVGPYILASSNLIIIIIIIRQPLCPVVGRRPQHAVSKLSCIVRSFAICHIVSLQYLSRSSLHRLAGLPCRLFLSYGLQVVTREVHRSSLRRLICPAQDHFIFLTVWIISMIFVLSLTQMLVFLSR